MFHLDEGARLSCAHQVQLDAVQDAGNVSRRSSPAIEQLVDNAISYWVVVAVCVTKSTTPVDSLLSVLGYASAAAGLGAGGSATSVPPPTEVGLSAAWRWI